MLDVVAVLGGAAAVIINSAAAAAALGLGHPQSRRFWVENCHLLG